MSEPTTAEMVAWCEVEARSKEIDASDARHYGEPGDHDSLDADAAMLRAIAARLRQASGKAEPAPTWQGEKRENG